MQLGLLLSSLLTLLVTFAGKKNGKERDLTSPDAVEINSKVIVENLKFPWEILWGPDNHIWMTERNGRISRVNPSTGSVIPVFTINEVESRGEGGLLGMTLHPQFHANPHVFVAYNYERSGNYLEKIVRYTYNGSTLIDPVTLMENIEAAGIHNGCRLLIAPDLKLFITTGDAADQSLPQNMSSRNGKILRINLDGTIPSDNPIKNSPVWTSGHRNAQGIVFANNFLYSSEHGPDSDDEINIIERGRNYGWPTVKGFCNTGHEHDFCSANNVKEPLKAWSPTLAVCGLDFYNKDLIPQLKNSLILCTLKGSRLLQLKLNAAHNAINETKEIFNNKHGRLRDVCISDKGIVYICTSNGNDKIIELTKNSP